MHIINGPRQVRGPWLAAAVAAAFLIGACSSSKTQASSGGSQGSSTLPARTTLSSTKAIYPPIPDGNIKLGMLIPLTGPQATIGTTLKTQYEAMIGVLNSQGGIAGRQVELVEANDQADPTVAVSEAQNLVSQKVAAILYSGSTNVALQAAAVFMKAKLPIVQIQPSNDLLDTQKWPYFFGMNASNADAAAQLMAFAKSKGATKLGIINDGTVFGTSLTKDVSDSAPKAGLTVTATVPYSSTAVDVTTQVRQLKDSGADSIAVLASVGVQHVWDAMHSLGWSPPIYTSSASLIVGYASMKDLTAKGSIWCYGVHDGEQLDADTAKIMELVTSKTTLTPSNNTVPFKWHAILAVKSAIETQKSLDGDAVKSYMESLKDKSFGTSPLKYTFTSQNHDGFPPSQIGICRMDKFAPFDIPILVS